MPRKRKDPVVLVIEEDEQIRESLSDMLTERGWSAIGVRTAGLGIELLERGFRPRVIVLDPFTRNGAQHFKHALAEREPLDQIPLLVGPGGLAAGVERTFRCEHHLHAPLDVPELIRLVHTYCRGW